MGSPEDSKNENSTEVPGGEEQGRDEAIAGLENTILEQGEEIERQGTRIDELGEQVKMQGDTINEIGKAVTRLGAASGKKIVTLSGIKPVKHPVTRKWVSPEVAKKAQKELDKEKKK